MAKAMAMAMAKAMAMAMAMAMALAMAMAMAIRGGPYSPTSNTTHFLLLPLVGWLRRGH